MPQDQCKPAYIVAKPFRGARGIHCNVEVEKSGTHQLLPHLKVLKTYGNSFQACTLARFHSLPWRHCEALQWKYHFQATVPSTRHRYSTHPPRGQWDIDYSSGSPTDRSKCRLERGWSHIHPLETGSSDLIPICWDRSCKCLESSLMGQRTVGIHFCNMRS